MSQRDLLLRILRDFIITTKVNENCRFYFNNKLVFQKTKYRII